MDETVGGTDQQLMRPRVITECSSINATPELTALIDEDNVLGKRPESFTGFYEFWYSEDTHDDGAGLLYDFVNVTIEMDEVQTANILAELPWTRSLPRLCPHLLPIGHCEGPSGVEMLGSHGEPPDLGPFYTPIEAVLFYCYLFRQIVDAGREIATRKNPAVDRRAIPVTNAPDAIEDFLRQAPEAERPTGSLPEAVGETLRYLALWSGIRETFHWIGHTPERHYTAADPVLGTLTIQAYEYLRSGEMRVCDCGRVIDMADRKRRPQRNRKAWCYRCRADGRDKLDYEKRRTATRRAERKKGKDR